MPIVGVTDRGGELPRLGILRKGAPKSERAPGRDLKDHFRFETDDADAKEAFYRIYGAKPNHIRIMLPFPTTEENFDAWREHWKASALQRRCTGETCVQYLTDNGTYSFEHKPCVCAGMSADTEKRHLCQYAGRLKIIIPELERLAYILVTTTSFHDVRELQNNLEAIEAMRGDLSGIGFVLSRRKSRISTPDDKGNRRRMEKWLLSIETDPAWTRKQLAYMKQRALPNIAVAALPAPDDDMQVDEETGEIIESTAHVWTHDPDEAPEPESETATYEPVPYTLTGVPTGSLSYFSDGTPIFRGWINDQQFLAFDEDAENLDDKVDTVESVTLEGVDRTHHKIGAYLHVTEVLELKTHAVTGQDLIMQLDEIENQLREVGFKPEQVDMDTISDDALREHIDALQATYQTIVTARESATAEATP